MNRWREAVQLYAGAVPNPFAVYRAPIFGGGSLLPFEVGIASFALSLPDLAAITGIPAHVEHEKEVVDQLNALEASSAGRPYDDEQKNDYAALRERREAVQSRLTELREREAYRQKIAGDAARTERSGTDLTPRSQQRSRIPENVFDLGEYHARSTSDEGKAALIRDGARKAIELIKFAHPKADQARSAAHLEQILASTDDERASVSRYILATASPTYQRAWSKQIAGRPLSNEERAAIDVVGTTTAGGYNVPIIMDPVVVLTTDGNVNPIREMAQVVQIGPLGNTYRVITSGGFVLTRGPAEDLAVTDTGPVFDKEEVTVQPVKGEIRYSVEADEDWPRLQATLAQMIQEAKDEEEANSFINGVGTTVYPAGVVETLDASSLVGTGSNGFDIADVDRLEGRLGAKYRSKAEFLANLAIYQAVDRFSINTTGAGGAYRPSRAAGLPATLNGRTAREASYMEDDYTTEGNDILLFGDFNYYLIVDKIGLSVEIDPHVRDGDGKALFKRALLIHYRNSAVILNHNAFRLLRVGVVTS